MFKPGGQPPWGTPASELVALQRFYGHQSYGLFSDLARVGEEADMIVAERQRLLTWLQAALPRYKDAQARTRCPGRAFLIARRVNELETLMAQLGSWSPLVVTVAPQ